MASSLANSAWMVKLLADIFQGKISNWNDKRIADLNPGVKIPSGDITDCSPRGWFGNNGDFHRLLSKSQRGLEVRQLELVRL